MDSTNINSLGKKTTKSINGTKRRYLGVKAMRGGHLVIKNKRIGGKVRLTAGQKAGLKKAHMKAGTANAIKMRVRSLKKGHKMGIYKHHDVHNPRR